MTGKRTNQRIAFWIFRILGLIVVGILFWILGFIIWHGAGVINWKFLTTAPTDGMTDGGIFPAIVGTFCLIAGSMVVAFPLGVMSAIYTTEYAGNGKIVRFIRIMTNNPRKIVGLEGYGIEIVGREPIEVGCCATNEEYMRTKQEKMGHMLHVSGDRK